MSFDSHSLERLRELGRKLPSSLPLPNTKSSKKNKQLKEKLHPIETEQDPKKLFGELINASPDGNIPAHLLERLRQTEAISLEQKVLEENFPQVDLNEIPVRSNNSITNARSPQNELYISFERLLQEEDD